MRRLEVQIHKFVWGSERVLPAPHKSSSEPSCGGDRAVQMSDGTLYSVSFYREQGGDSLVLGMKASEGAILSKSQSIQDAGIASCVSGPRLAHVFLWYWFDGPGVKKARRGAESEEEHQVCDGSTLKRISRCRPCPGVDV
ncbi:hypothetical protein D6D25_09495 [Aureobasidium pullulans]|nr:hypothetical protein D6D25_09495 [Aureobasidium pullulans]